MLAGAKPKDVECCFSNFTTLQSPEEPVETQILTRKPKEGPGPTAKTRVHEMLWKPAGPGLPVAKNQLLQTSALSDSPSLLFMFLPANSYHRCAMIRHCVNKIRSLPSKSSLVKKERTHRSTEGLARNCQAL